ncbi:MAG: glycosyltransferase family 39 protein [Elusimicrobia bacterium]|nr:glycosyltransferase family 39 protein [Elusimicrobiota bacterium]
MRTAPLAAAVLLSVLAASLLGAGPIRSTGPTYDEPVHLAAGYTDLVHGRYRLNALDHPPLGEMWAALPLLTMRLDRFESHPAWLSAAVYHYGDLFLYHNRVPPGSLLGAARAWNLVTLTLLVAAALLLWARRLEGDAGMWGAAVALGFCVPWLSNAALVTTDAPSAALFFAACAALAAPERTRRHWLLAGLAAGAALAAKFNMIVLPPLLAFALGVDRRPEAGRASRAAGAALGVLAAVLALAAAYRFVRADLWFAGLSATLTRLSEGRSAYLLGAHSSTGWPWYLPAATLVKTPLALLLVGGWGFARALRKPRADAAWLVVPPCGYFVAALLSKTQIGYRHVLPLYPFLCLWAGLGAADLWRRGTRGRAAAVLAGLWLAASVGANHPRHLAYFNELAGGHGERWLSDSNLDWGQDLPALARELAARGNPPVVLAYFGGGDPAAYGIRYAPLAVVANVERPGNAALASGGPVWLAVSETNLVGTYYRDHGLFDWLSSRTPAAKPGGSIWLYDLTADADARARLSAMLAAAGRYGDALAVRLH